MAGTNQMHEIISYCEETDENGEGNPHFFLHLTPKDTQEIKDIAGLLGLEPDLVALQLIDLGIREMRLFVRKQLGEASPY